MPFPIGCEGYERGRQEELNVGDAKTNGTMSRFWSWKAFIALLIHPPRLAPLLPASSRVIEIPPRLPFGEPPNPESGIHLLNTLPILKKRHPAIKEV